MDIIKIDVVIKVNSERYGKINRILWIHSKLTQGDIINKLEMAKLFKVDEKSIQRDLDDIRSYFSENIQTLGLRDIVYQRSKKGYVLKKDDHILMKEDILAIIKILLESRAFGKEELTHLTTAVLGQVSNEQKKSIKDIIGNELSNYVPLNHKDILLPKIWELSELIRKCEKTEITYIRMDGSEVKRIIKPVSIIFSEYYFYLIAYFNNLDSPTVLRIDRIKIYKTTGEKFYEKYSERFEDGEFRKRIQFMFSGKLEKIKFEFWGSSIEAVLDRIPTAKIIDKCDDKYLVEAEVYGKGIIMWILSQGSHIKVIEPVELVKEIKEIVCGINNLYL